MSRVTEFPEGESRPLKERPATAGEEAEAGERVAEKLAKLSPARRIAEFYKGVKQEMRKTSWPTWTDVRSTTVVVLIAVVFFGFYLWGVDRLVTLGFRYLEKVFK